MPVIDNAIYDRIHDMWWSDDSFMALLRNSINGPRFDYFQSVLDACIGISPAGVKLLDVGCGGGLLAEKFAAAGYDVTGVDRSEPTLAAARAHSESMGLTIRYLQGTGELLPSDARQFDIVCCCDVLEHVEDVQTVIAEISRVMKPGGIFFFDTINRTFLSRLLTIKIAQDWAPTRFVPKNVHVWDKYIKPSELAAMMTGNGLRQHEFVGLSPPRNPLKILGALIQLKLGGISYGDFGHRLRHARSGDLLVSYMGHAVRSHSI